MLENDYGRKNEKVIFNTVLRTNEYRAFGLGRIIYQHNKPVVPKFQAGDCVVHELRDEFDVTYLYLIIEKVGKKEYLTRSYVYLGDDVSTGYSSGRPFGVSIEYIDSDRTKTICPKIIKIH